MDVFLHHVDDDYDDRSRSRLPSRSRRSPSRSPSRSPRRSESPEIENHFVEIEDDDHKPPAKPAAKSAAKPAAASASRRSSSDGKKAASSSKKAPRKREPRWVREKKRDTVEYDPSSGKKTGFGSWYKRPYEKFSRSEIDAPDGHPDRIRTIYIPNGHDYLEREWDDDSEKSSDWYDRTGVRPKNSK